MKNRVLKNRVLWMFVAVAALVAPLRAHHTFSAEFDDKQPVLLKGTVSKFEMVMPHSFLYLDVTDEKGKSTTWAIEFSNPNQLFRAGWTKNTMKTGMELTVKGWRAKDGSNKAQGTFVQFADGTTLLNQGAAREGAPAAR